MDINWSNERGNQRESVRIAGLSTEQAEHWQAQLEAGWQPPYGVTPDDDREMLLTRQDAARQGLPR